MPRRHEIPSTPEAMVWGYLDCSTPPILEVSSGDTVTLHSFPAGGKETLPDDLSLVAADYMKALETLPPGPGPHFITGPVYVKGAHVGDALQIDILDVKVRQDWGFVSILPLLGTLPDEFTDYETIHPAIDRLRSICRSSMKAHCSSRATVTPSRATARCALPHWKPASPAPSVSPSARIWSSIGRLPRAQHI
jgi:acetamidase/formamidase